MASEYLKRKYQDVKPDEPPPPLTGRARLANWLHYNKLWIAVWLVLLSVLGNILWNAPGIGQIKPDYVFAYVGSDPLPEDCAAALEAELASLGTDANGDGRVKVELRQYAANRSGDMETAMYYNYAADVALAADMTAADSYFFLMEDPAGVQAAYQILARADGTPPDDSDFETDGKVFRWSSCPVLAGLAVDYAPLDGLYIGRRCFYEGQTGGQEADIALWETITEGAR